jgi:hypothetical protein
MNIHKPELINAIFTFNLRLTAMPAWELLWNSNTVSENGYCGWVRSFEEAENVRRLFQVETSLTFVSGKKEAQFGRSEISKLVVH